MRNRGSSPLTRGALSLRGAGSFLSEAHPRSRGEHVIMAFIEGFKAGSSPLTRGAPRR